ncbi:hypothetical protein ACF05T_03885 [Streptomyces lateritius]|uniref:Uncharacterized protein n=1 Tax=Streptomyces lateritius TaxID=67313 RepID=A0ABW6Y616_9ACTN
MRRLVEDGTLARARAVAAEGVEALCGGPEPRGRRQRPVLEPTKHHEAEYAAGERRPVLVPLVFAERSPLCSTDGPQVLAVTFHAGRHCPARAGRARRRGPARTDARPRPHDRPAEPGGPLTTTASPAGSGSCSA